MADIVKKTPAILFQEVNRIAHFTRTTDGIAETVEVSFVELTLADATKRVALIPDYVSENISLPEDLTCGGLVFRPSITKEMVKVAFPNPRSNPISLGDPIGVAKIKAFDKYFDWYVLKLLCVFGETPFWIVDHEEYLTYQYNRPDFHPLVLPQQMRPERFYNLMATQSCRAASDIKGKSNMRYVGVLQTYQMHQHTQDNAVLSFLNLCMGSNLDIL